jgi:lysophospholipase L1-like esterase
VSPAAERLELTCSDVRLDDVRTPAQPVTFAPARRGGTEPVIVSCTPASGTEFPVGTTAVSCSASDASSPPQSAACSMNVTLTARVPDLSATTFMAFGDSITAGEIGDVKEGPGPCDPGTAAAPATLFPQPRYRNPDQGYAAVVLRMLRERYTRQTFTMINEGVGQETAQKGYLRFPGAFDEHQPDVVLLLEGILDIRDEYIDDPTRPIEPLESDIRYAKRRGVKAVLISTLLPYGDGFQSCAAMNATVRETNDLIRGVAAAEGALLVDPYAAFAADLDRLMGSDGLHPTVAGHEALGAAFFDVIRKNLEAPAAAVTARRPQAVR